MSRVLARRELWIKQYPAVGATDAIRTSGPELTRPWSIFILLLTLAYLCVEMPFAAHLLDIVGTTADQEIIHNTEVIGRCISGFAAALLFWGLSSIPRGIRRGRSLAKQGEKPRTPIRRTLAISLFGGFVIAVGVYIGLERLVDQIVSWSTAEDRQTAMAVLIFTNEYQKGRASITNSPLADADLSKPEGKTFIALLPALAFGLKDIRKKLDPAVRSLAKNKVIETIGSPTGFYKKAYLDALTVINQDFVSYYDGLSKVEKATADAERRANTSWSDYKQKLRGKGQRLPVGGYVCRRVKSEMDGRGNPYPKGWNCNNERQYKSHIVSLAMQQANRVFNNAIQKSLGARLPQSIRSPEEFLRQPAVQAKWRETTKAPASFALRYGVSFEQFTEQVYLPKVETNVNEQMQRIKADVKEFNLGGRFHAEGVDAYRALVVPPVALLFSLLGAITHMVKIAGLIVKFFVPGATFMLVGPVYCFGLLLAASTLLKPNTLTSSELFQKLIRETNQSAGFGAGLSMSWIAHTQPLLYPFNSAIRQLVFGPAGPLHGTILETPLPSTARVEGSVSRTTQKTSPGSLPKSSATETQVRVSKVKTVEVADKAQDETTSSPPAPDKDQQSSTNVKTRTACGGVSVQSHRGHPDYPENSVSGTLAAFEVGFAAVELDLQRLGDGTFVFHHDQKFGRTVSGATNHAAMTASSWAQTKLRDRTGKSTTETPPTLKILISESLPWLQQGRHLNIEFKQVFDCPTMSAAVREMKAAGARSEDLELTSIDPRAMSCLSGIHSGYKGQIVVDPGTLGASKETLFAQTALLRTLSPKGIEAWKMKALRPSGMHLASGLAARDSSLIQRLKNASVPVTLFSSRGSDQEILDIIRERNSDKPWMPRAIVIDGMPNSVCGALELL